MWGGHVLTTSKKGVLTTSNVSVETGATIRLIAANGNRKSLILQNQGSGTVFIGATSTVAISGTARGYALFTGASFTDDATAGEWWAISGTGTNIVNVQEVV